MEPNKRRLQAMFTAVVENDNSCNITATEVVLTSATAYMLTSADDVYLQLHFYLSFAF